MGAITYSCPNLIDLIPLAAGSSPVPSGGSPYDMSMLDNALPPSYEPQRKKSAADFLGDNANLVNLDNLVTKPQTQAGKLTGSHFCSLQLDGVLQKKTLIQSLCRNNIGGLPQGW